MKIISGGYEILQSGVLYCPNTNETKFIISEEPKMDILVRLILTEDKKPNLSLDAVNEYTMAFVFTNPTSLGYGNAEPVKIGYLNGRELFASFHISLKGSNNSYDLNYTFSFRETVNV